MEYALTILALVNVWLIKDHVFKITNFFYDEPPRGELTEETAREIFVDAMK